MRFESANAPIDVPGMPGFLLWARRDNPKLYAAMKREIPAVAQFDAALQVDAGMNGIADILKSVGSSVTNAAKSIGSFVKNNALPIATAALPLVVAAKEAKIARTQLELAQTMNPPMLTAPGAGGVAVPVRPVNTPGFTPATPYPYDSSPPSTFGTFITRPVLGVPTWVWLAGVGGIGLYMSLRAAGRHG